MITETEMDAKEIERRWVTVVLDHPGPLHSKLARLPVGPAIYAICPSISIPDGLTGPLLLARLHDVCERSHAPELATALGPFERVAVRPARNIPYSYLATADRTSTLLDDENFVEEIRMVMGAVQEILPPFYVGETRRLQDRISEHLATTSELRQRLAQQGIDIATTAIRYFKLADGAVEEDVRESSPYEVGEEDEPDQDDDFLMVTALTGDYRPLQRDNDLRNQRLFLEELITRICKPRFVEKIGSHIITTKGS